MPLSLTIRMSSKTNISRRICSTRSGSSASRPSMIAFSVARSARLRISATVGTPPAFSMLWVSMFDSRLSRPSLDLLDDLRVGLLHVGDALDDLDLLLHGQPGQDLRRLVVRQVAHDQRDGLRVLILDERQQVLALGLLQEAERRLLHLRLDLLQHPLGRLAVQRLLEQHLRVLQPALVDVLARDRQAVELLHDRRCSSPPARARARRARA